MRLRLPKSRLLLAVLVVGLALLLTIPAGSIYYAAAGGKACVKCHEIGPAYEQWHQSSHRNVQCKECHGSIFSTDMSFHWNNVHQLWLHLRGKVPDRLLVRQRDISRGLNERCANCHQQEYASWQAGPHGISYAAIFLDESHNRQRQLADHCLQCHGMYFEQGIRELVTPLDSKGPWQFAAQPELAKSPSIPCLACHEIHKPGEPLKREVASTSSGQTNAPTGEAHVPSLGFYDRREQLHFSADLLPLPQMKEHGRAVVMSPDRRQTLCYQCHASDHEFQIGSGDDRTCVGVHEGISCLACHQKHNQSALASCSTCHPRMSNCGLDVEMMDTTFKLKSSSHNIHFVKCLDCHPGGVPHK